MAKAYLTKGELTKAGRCLKKAKQAKEDKVEPAVVDWHLEYIQAVEKPTKLEDDYMKKIAGDYGPRHLQFKNGRLYYFREGGTYPEARPLTAMSRDTFIMEGLSRFRLKVEFDEKGNPLKLVGLYIDGMRRDESPRGK